MVTRRLIDKIKSHCGVQITMIKSGRSDEKANFVVNECDAEEVQVRRNSKDGIAWKLLISGHKVGKAVKFLKSNRDEIRVRLGLSANGVGPSLSSLSTIHGGVAYLSGSSTEGKIVVGGSGQVCQDIKVPRNIFEGLKLRMPSIRGNCKNSNVALIPPSDKSTSFARIRIEAADMSDKEKALNFLWREVCNIYISLKLPMSEKDLPQHVGFFAGKLDRHQVHHLLCHGHGAHSDDEIWKSSFDTILSAVFSRRVSSFLPLFEAQNLCSISIEPEEGTNNSNLSTSSNIMLIFISCEPNRIVELWLKITERTSQLYRGVRFLDLGTDDALIPQLQNKRFGNNLVESYLDFVEKTVHCKISIDNLTKKYLQIDASERGRDTGTRRAALAEQMILVQVELLKYDSCRKHCWGFGRDWTNLGEQIVAVIEPSKQTTLTSQLEISCDPRSLMTYCSEMAEIAESLSLNDAILAHAVIIFFRFSLQTTNVARSKKKLRSPFPIQHKVRDILLGSLFIANKAQKSFKWKRLEVILESAYQVFYPGSNFAVESEEANSWESRVLSAEVTILSTLDYDVFWSGVDSVANLAITSGNVAEPLVQNVIDATLSIPIFSAGPDLWLKLGLPYIFTAMLGFMGVDLNPVVLALRLKPDLVTRAAELMARAVNESSSLRTTQKKKSRKSINSTQQLSAAMKATIINGLASVKNQCAAIVLDFHRINGPSKQLQIVARRTRKRRVLRKMDNLFITKKLLPAIPKMTTESKCQIFLDPTINNGFCNVILEGSWRALMLAEYFLKNLFLGFQHEKCTNTGMNHSSFISNLAPSVFPFKSEDMPYITDDITTAGSQVYEEPRIIQVSNFRPIGSFYYSRPSTNALETISSEGKMCLNQIVPYASLRKAGIGWWSQQKSGMSLRGSLREYVSIHECAQKGSCPEDAVQDIMNDIFGTKNAMKREKEVVHDGSSQETVIDYPREELVSTSLQRWPSLKVELREKGKSDGQHKTKMDIGFSPAALQEMQLLHQVHRQVPSTQGHPNFVLPLAIAVPCNESKKNSFDQKRKESNGFALGQYPAKYKLLEDQSQVAENCLHLVFEPLPISFSSILNRGMKRERDSIPKQFRSITIPKQKVTLSLLTTWFHDLLSAMSHCHSNFIVMRTLNPDNFHLDYSGVAKISGLAMSTVISKRDIRANIDPLKTVSKKIEKNTEKMNDTFQAPELLLGATKYSSETDVWCLGCLIAHLMLGKPLFRGNDRYSLMSSIFKVVGTPTNENYPDATKYPLYEKCLPQKNNRRHYKRGVVKALRYILGNTEDILESYDGVIFLLDRMLHLDPNKRISAKEALDDPIFGNVVNNHSVSDIFRAKFIKDWLSLKRSLNGVEEDDIQNTVIGAIGKKTKSERINCNGNRHMADVPIRSKSYNGRKPNGTTEANFPNNGIKCGHDFNNSVIARKEPPDDDDLYDDVPRGNVTNGCKRSIENSASEEPTRKRGNYENDNAAFSHYCYYM